VLFVTGENSLKSSGIWDQIASELTHKSISYSKIHLAGEPSPLFIDESVQKFRNKNIELVIAIGGGSVTDAGKAISAMIPKRDSIKNYLEGIGTKVHDGNKIPFIAIPTTSGTGSEATKNAVISEVGPDGFKKSLRHDNLIPNVAIIDPKLTISCPPSITAMCGMDAFTQLLEGYVSSKRNPITNALAFSGLKYMSKNLLRVCSTESSDVIVRSAMAYGSLISGITLANVGLGIVHGLASPIGGFFDIPHGVVCGTLLSEATKMNIKRLQDKKLSDREVLRNYAHVGGLIAGKNNIDDEKIDEYCSILTDSLDNWTAQLKLDRLGKYGIKMEDVGRIISKTGIKNNPVNLEKGDIREIIINRL
jgi:alcohol dehydrogenase class IV